jgi:large subunit ribosomal protein L25
MEELVLSAKRRQVVGKQVRALRREGQLPAVLYGRSFQPISITLDARESNRIIPTITSSHLITISLEGEKHSALVREKQYNPILGTLVHVDFYVVSMTEKLRALVTLQVEGDAPAVKEFDGVLVTGVEEVEVECLPAYLPERILVDISGLLKIGDSIHVRDLQVVPEVEVLTDLDEMVVLVTAPEAEEVEEVEAAVPEPEVIEKGRKEEEEF